MTQVFFYADASAPRRARVWLNEQTRLDRIRRAEAGLLLSELVTSAVDGKQPDSRITVSEDVGPGTVIVDVRPSDGAFSPDPTGFRDLLLEKVARRWGEEPGRIWFEVRAPGGAERGITSLDTSDLLERAAEDVEAREEAASRFAFLAQAVARRFRGKGVADDDLQQVAMFGLIKALERFDSSLGRFEPYATKTISGELKRLLRDSGWSMKVPRSLKERALEVGRANQELTQRLGRQANAEDIALELDLDVDEVIEALASRSAYRLGSIDSPFDDDDGASIGNGLPSSDRERLVDDDWHEVGAALAVLPERERQILEMRFYHDMTQSEIATTLGISQMHVSRLLSRALDRARSLID